MHQRESGLEEPASLGRSTATSKPPCLRSVFWGGVHNQTPASNTHNRPQGGGAHITWGAVILRIMPAPQRGAFIVLYTQIGIVQLLEYSCEIANLTTGILIQT